MTGKKNTGKRTASDLDLGDFAFSGTDFGFKDEISLEEPETDDPAADFTKVDIEAEAKGEISDLLAAFKERAAREDQRVDEVTDSEFWFCLCFQSRAQKDEFLSKLGWDEIGDKYLDGIAAADMIGVALESAVLPMPNIRIDQKLAALARNITNGITGGKKKRKFVLQQAED